MVEDLNSFAGVGLIDRVSALVASIVETQGLNGRTELLMFCLGIGCETGMATRISLELLPGGAKVALVLSSSIVLSHLAHANLMNRFPITASV